MLRQALALVVGVVAMTAPVSVEPAFAETSERLEYRREAQPSVSQLQEPLQPTEEVSELEPSRAEETVEAVNSYSSESFTRVVDLARPTLTYVPRARPALPPTIVQPSSQPEPTQVKKTPRAKTVETLVFEKEKAQPIQKLDIQPKTEPSSPLEPSQPVSQKTEHQSLLITPEVTYDFKFESQKRVTPTLELEAAFSLDRETTINLMRLEPSRMTPAHPQDISKIKPIKPIAKKRVRGNNIVPFKRVTRVTPVSQSQIPVSARVLTLQNVSNEVIGTAKRGSVLLEKPVMVEEHRIVTATAPGAKPRVTGTAKVGIVVGTKTTPTLETAVGLSYEGYEATLRMDKSLRDDNVTIGIDSKFPLSDTTSLTVTADNLTATKPAKPEISATLEHEVSRQLTTSVTFRDITNKPDVDLAAEFELNERTKVGVGLANLGSQPQLNLEAAHKISKHTELSAKVDNITSQSSVGFGIAVELSPETKLEARANDVFGATSYEARMTYTFTF